MHKYLRAVGFSSITKRADEEALIRKAAEEYTFCSRFTDVEGDEQVELDLNVSDNVGIIVRGTLKDDQTIDPLFYFPYAISEKVTTNSPCEVERKMKQDGFSCLCEDPRLGISLIFHMINTLEYSKEADFNNCQPTISECCLSALSVRGAILIPLKKTDKQIQIANNIRKRRSKLVEAASHGDESAMETLTLQDMNMYANITRRITRDRADLYTVLESFFMPYGVECDEYSILGTILSVETLTNSLTGEVLYRMIVECNDLRFPVVINEADCVGIPMVGRRFKGDVWMQGVVNMT